MKTFHKSNLGALSQLQVDQHSPCMALVPSACMALPSACMTLPAHICAHLCMQVRTEMAIHHSLVCGQTCGHVVPLLATFEDARSYFIVLEHADSGDLSALMRKGRLTESKCRDSIAQPLLQALAVLQHEVGASA